MSVSVCRDGGGERDCRGEKVTEMIVIHRREGEGEIDHVDERRLDDVDDVEKLDTIRSQAKTTGLQYLNSHILCNRLCVQQQHVDHKIADTLLKKGTKEHGDGWDEESRIVRSGHTWSSTCRMLREALV